jgi:hypothetical protein
VSVKIDADKKYYHLINLQITKTIMTTFKKTIAGLVWTVVVLWSVSTYAWTMAALNVWFESWTSYALNHSMSFSPWSAKEFAPYTQNMEDYPVEVEMYFVDGIKRSRWVLCYADAYPKRWFWKYAKFIDDNGQEVDRLKFTLQPGESIAKRAKIAYPSSYTNTRRNDWCVITKSWVDSDPVTWALNVQLRRWSTIDLY